METSGGTNLLADAQVAQLRSQGLLSRSMGNKRKKFKGKQQTTQWAKSGI